MFNRGKDTTFYCKKYKRCKQNKQFIKIVDKIESIFHFLLTNCSLKMISGAIYTTNKC